MRLASDFKTAVNSFSITDTAKGTLYGHAEGVEFSFFEYRYPLLVPLVD